MEEKKKKSGLKLKGCTIRSEKLTCKNAMFLLFYFYPQILGIQFMIMVSLNKLKLHAMAFTAFNCLNVLFQIINIMLFESPYWSFPLPWHVPCAFAHLLFSFVLFSVIHVPPMQQGALQQGA